MNSKIEVYKQQFLRESKIVHMNNAGLSPMSLAVYKTLQDWNNIYLHEGAASYAKLLPAIETARTNMSLFLGCHSDELAMVETTAVALSQVAFGLKLNPGDELIVWDQEYPSNFYPWREAAKKAGAKLVVLASPTDLSMPMEMLEAAITSKTKVIALSWVQYKSGAVADLKAISKLAKSKNIFTCADVIQGVGHYPFNFRDSGFDAVCGGAHKWLSAANLGFLIMRKELIPSFYPTRVGTWSYNSPGDHTTYSEELEPNARRFEPGGRAFSNILALESSMQVLSDVGMDVVANESARLCLILKDGLEALGYKVNSPHLNGFRGAIINFSPGPKTKFKSLEEISQALTDKNITHTIRFPGVRLSPHAHNLDEDVQAVLSAL